MVNKNSNYPENLYYAIFGVNYEIKYTPEIGDRIIFVMKNFNLDERFKKVIQFRYQEGLTLRECAERLNLKTAERIRQLEASALRKLRHPIRSKFIKFGELIIPRKIDVEPDDFWSVNGINMDFVKSKRKVRIYNCCLRSGIDNFGKILDLSKEELYRIRNLGKESIRDIIKYFETLGINADKFK